MTKIEESAMEAAIALIDSVAWEQHKIPRAQALNLSRELVAFAKAHAADVVRPWREAAREVLSGDTLLIDTLPKLRALLDDQIKPVLDAFTTARVAEATRELWEALRYHSELLGQHTPLRSDCDACALLDKETTP